jgi:hypothetical protein
MFHVKQRHYDVREDVSQPQARDQVHPSLLKATNSHNPGEAER